MKKLILPLFFLLAAIQLFVPAEMIWKKEAILTKGQDYKFRTEPIDPYDPFVGKYIVLRFRERPFRVARKNAPKNTEFVYVTFKKNKEGFAEIAEVSDKIPHRNDYLKTAVNTSDEEKDSTTL